MTALASPVQQSFRATTPSPSLPRLVSGAGVGAIGIIVLSVAVGGYVVGSSHALVSAQADEARRLVATTPLLVVLGLVHLVAAVALVRGRDLFRMAAVLVTGLAALAATMSAAMLSAGVDPFGPGPARASTSVIGLLVVVGFVYGTAAVAGGSGTAGGPSGQPAVPEPAGSAMISAEVARCPSFRVTRRT